MLPPELLPPLPRSGDERAMLGSFLEYFRSVLLRKVRGLTTEQSQRLVPPSTIHMHGLVRHLAFVEQYWFENIFAGSDEVFHWDDPTDNDRDFHPLPNDELSSDLSIFLTQVERSRQIASSAGSLDQLGSKQREGQVVSLRWIMIHMIEEYARHCGHADFLREAVDGVTGD